MPELKTKKTESSVSDFLNAIPDAQVRKDCWTIAKLMQGATKAKPKMWGSAIVGFGTRKLVYAGGRTADWMVVAFSPRKGKLVLYVLDDSDRYDDLLAKLGPHSGGKGCLYLKRLSDVHLPTLKKLIHASAAHRTSRR
ncbi:MAG TPA: hypothetical protein VJP87_02375 [Candidatus Acidoferrales bacterium]|nr:hypothetical protein [Candidatus Acidoferrales bacterium]